MASPGVDFRGGLEANRLALASGSQTKNTNLSSAWSGPEAVQRPSMNFVSDCSVAAGAQQSDLLLLCSGYIVR